jgi:DNA-binding response OmpR family regulator/HPt (histidine-containing phosphotransfer) domain-containing protein
MTSQNEFDDKLRTDYIQEAKELIADAEICFVQLERDKGNKDLIDSIFRMIHTVKGSGSIVGFDSFTRFAHQFEGLLAQIRAGTLVIDDKIMNLMFESNDVLKNWLNALLDDYYVEWDTSATANRLAAYSDSQLPKVTPAPAFGFFEDEPAAFTPETRMATVLLVDDEADILDLYENFLEGMPIRKLRALDGREAVVILEKEVPDLMVFDLRMPNMNGMELLAHVRKKFPDIPIIFVSGYSNRADIISMLNMGAFAFLGKPLTREQFLNEVRNGLRQRATRQDVLKLTQLNFLAFLTLAKMTHSREPAQKKENELKMKAILDDIVHIQNSILEAKYDQLVD